MKISASALVRPNLGLTLLLFYSFSHLEFCDSTPVYLKSESTSRDPVDSSLEVTDEPSHLIPQICKGLGLPPLDEEDEYRYYNKTGTCYKVGSVGPCGEDQRFYFSVDVYGACFCDYDKYFGYIALQDDGHCYEPYTQGPCLESEWIVRNESYDVVCEPRSCPTGEPRLFPMYDGKCYELGSRGPCRFGFAVNNVGSKFDCVYSPPATSITFKENPCPAGFKRVGGFCKEEIIEEPVCADDGDLLKKCE